MVAFRVRANRWDLVLLAALAPGETWLQATLMALDQSWTTVVSQRAQALAVAATAPNLLLLPKVLDHPGLYRVPAAAPMLLARTPREKLLAARHRLPLAHLLA